jgi:hypothetical protein
MAYAITHNFPDGTEEQYRAALAAVHPADGSLPAGQSYHAAGPTDEGWMIIAIFDSKEDWERFRDQELRPGLQSAEGAFAAPPQESAFEVANLQHS